MDKVQKFRRYAVNRLEVINHTEGGSGREFVKWAEERFEVELSVQDDGRTLKIFLSEKT